MENYEISPKEFASRRINLVKKLVQKEFVPRSLTLKKSAFSIYIIVVGNFETNDAALFRQEANFFYLTGLSLAGLILVMEVKLTYHQSQWNITHFKEWIFQPNAYIRSQYQLNVESWARTLNRTQHKQFQFQDVNSHSQNPKWVTANIDLVVFYHEFTHFLKNLHPDSFLFLNKEENAATGKLSAMFIDNIIKLQIINVPIQSCTRYIEILRQHKSEDEIKIIQHATQLSVHAHLHVFKELVQNRFTTDFQIEASFVQYFLSHGATPAYHPIVLVGQNGRNLHGTADGSRLQPQQLLLLDVAASYHGYKSDVTRTLPLKMLTFSPEQSKYYHFLVLLLEHVASFVKPGIFIYRDILPHGSSLQSITIQYVRASSFSEHDKKGFLKHGIGHHIGLETHDPEHEPLATNNVIALETGYYSKDINIRLENVYRVTETGFLLLSSLPLTIQQVEKKDYFIQEVTICLTDSNVTFSNSWQKLSTCFHS